MLLQEGLTQIHSQKKPWLHFGESFTSTNPLLDPLQFTYRASRSVDNAVNMALHYTLQYLDSPGTYARILFVDSSAILPAPLQDKLSQHHMPDSMSLNPRPLAPDPPQGCVFLPCSSPCTSTVAPPVTSPSSSWSSCMQVHAHWAHLWLGVHLQVGDWPSSELVQPEQAGA